jgi:uncharacterized membrane protein YphA (DoxX/SURF4 family)
VFFAASGWHKLTNAQRRIGLLATLREDLPKVGLPLSVVPFMSWWLPSWEFASGVTAVIGAVFVIPLLAKLAMLPIIAIMAVALVCECKSRVAAYMPIDWADYVDDVLYLPETLYLLIALAVIAI